MPVSQAPPATAPSDLAWRVIGLVNLYRLLVPLVLLAILFLPGPQAVLMAAQPSLFLTSCLIYFFVGVLMVVARRLSWPSIRRVSLLNAAVDSVAIAVILYSAGGVGSGLGILLVLPVGAMAVLGDNRDAFLIAAMAALAVLVQQIFTYLAGETAVSDYTNAGVLGAVLFAVALFVSPIASRLRESEATVRRQEVDLANMAQLSQYIVQHLREAFWSSTGRTASGSSMSRLHNYWAIGAPIPAPCSAKPRRDSFIYWKPGARPPAVRWIPASCSWRRTAPAPCVRISRRSGREPRARAGVPRRHEPHRGKSPADRSSPRWAGSRRASRTRSATR